MNLITRCLYEKIVLFVQQINALFKNKLITILLFFYRFMKEKIELQRVNYSLQKHHREHLRQQIDPKLIEKIEIANNPSLNYKKAFESVYHDELERALQYQEQRHQLQQRKSILPQISKSSSHQSLHQTRVSQNQNRASFADYDLERRQKFDSFINKGYDGGQSFFKAQDEYQKRRQFENKMNQNTLKQQLVINREKKTISKQKQNYQKQIMRENDMKMVETQKMKQIQRKQQHFNLGEQIKHQIQNDSIKRAKKSNYQYYHNGRHNPITNPIEYHIDNPYILKKYQDKNQLTLNR